MIRKSLLGLAFALSVASSVAAQTPQPIWMTGLYTLAAGPDNLQTNLPANAYCYTIAWAVDRPGGAGFMAADCGQVPAAWVTNAGPQGNTGPTGAAGAAGAPGTDGKTVLSGVGSPSGGLGTNGDYYLDVSVTRLYGPKTSGIWGTGVSLIGPTGSAGATGLAGSVGATGATGSTGATGAQGPKGDTGATGPAGSNGTNGTNGAAGVNSFGSPTSRALTAATAYQATDNTKPALVNLNLNSTASISLTGGTTNTADVVIGSTAGVASGTGTVICRYANTNTGSLTIGLNLSTVSGSTCSFALPASWYFAWRITAGTVTVPLAYDQPVG